MLPNAWWKSWLVWLGLGLVLFVCAGLALLSARRAQEAEQQRRDAHWQAVNAKALRSNPPLLPGEKKPEPAPLPSRGMIALLAIAATGAVARAGWLWLERLRSLWGPPRDEWIEPPPDRAERESAPATWGPRPPGPQPPGPQSRGPSPTHAPPAVPPASPRTEPLGRPVSPLPPPPVQRPPHRPEPPGTWSGDLPESRR
jgi:hypothetical protein